MRNFDDLGSRKAEGFLGRGGSVHVMGILMLIMALIGGGYLYISFKEKKVASDIPKILAAYEGMMDDYVKDPEDRAKFKQALGTLAGLIYKYNPTGINLKAVQEIEKRKMLLESSRPGGEGK